MNFCFAINVLYLLDLPVDFCEIALEKWAWENK